MFLVDDAADPVARLLLAHGAGAPMDHAFMSDVTASLNAHGVSVARFEFAFMAARRSRGGRPPSPRAEKLIDEYIAAVDQLIAQQSDGLQLYIGGKSLGGRVASLVADRLLEAGKIKGLVCLSYPFHPSGKPQNLRTAHLERLACPTLIVQGTRDPLGNRAEVGGYELSDAIRMHWAEDGDHDLKPRKRSGYTQRVHLDAAAQAVAEFARMFKVRRD